MYGESGPFIVHPPNTFLQNGDVPKHQRKPTRLEGPESPWSFNRKVRPIQPASPLIPDPHGCIIRTIAKRVEDPLVADMHCEQAQLIIFVVPPDGSGDPRGVPTVILCGQHPRTHLCSFIKTSELSRRKPPAAPAFCNIACSGTW